MISLKAEYVAIDTETTGLNPWGTPERWGFYPARPFAFAFFDSEGNTEYHRWEVDLKTRRVYTYDSNSFHRIQKILASPQTKVLHNASFDIRMLEMPHEFGRNKVPFKVRGTLHDTLILMHVITGGSEMSYALKPMSKKYLGISDEDQQNLLDSVNHARREGRKKGWKIADQNTNGRNPVMADY